MSGLDGLDAIHETYFLYMTNVHPKENVTAALLQSQLEKEIFLDSHWKSLVISALFHLKWLKLKYILLLF